MDRGTVRQGRYREAIAKTSAAEVTETTVDATTERREFT
jgi:hypothetical protein